MMYEQEFVENLTKQVSLDDYAQEHAVVLEKLLKNDKAYYKRYGVYWWAVKDALRKYAKNKRAWYCGASDDNLMKERAWHGDENRTCVAGAYYAYHQLSASGGHSWTDKEGNEHDYTLFDDNAGI